MKRDEAKRLYLALRSEGYSHDEAADALRAGKRPDDPTADYWKALIQQESGGRQSAVSPKGAVGIAQVMPTTGPEAAKLAGREWDELAYRQDPEYNSAIGRAYLRAQMRRFGDPKLGLAAYNAGPGRVQQHIDSGRPLPPETQNYVPAITGKSEAGMTRDQARQYAQKRLSEGADLDMIKQELASMNGAALRRPAMQQASMPAPSMAAQLTSGVQPNVASVPQPPVPPRSTTSRPNDFDEIAAGYLEEAWPEMSKTAGGRGIHALSRGATDVVRGARQLWNQLGYDEEDAADLAYLKNREKAAREFEQEINPKGSGLNVQDVAKIAPGMLAYGALGAGGGIPAIGGAVSGALTGAAAPVAPGESRMLNTAIGGGIGGVSDVARGSIKLANLLRDRMKNTVSSREAMHDFTDRALGSPKDGDIIPAYQNITGKIKSKLKSLEDDFSAKYMEVESNPNLSPVRLENTPVAARGFVMTDELAGILSPRTKRMLETVKAGHKPDEKAATASFREVREALREIKAAGRALKRGDPGRMQLKQASEMLETDLAYWIQRSDTNSRALSLARQLDKEYKDQVVPFYDKSTRLGKYMKSPMDERALGLNLLHDESGSTIKDLTERVPGIEKELRKVYGSKLREARGDVATIRKLESGTASEALLSKPEREYLREVAEEIYKEGGPAMKSSVMPTGMMRLLEKSTASQTLQRAIGNLRPYGAKKPDSYIDPRTDALVRYLRSAGIIEATGE